MAALLIIFSHRLAQIEKTWFWWCFLLLIGQNIVPCFVRIFHECDKINVVHKHESYHGNNMRESTMPLDASLQNRYQQIWLLGLPKSVFVWR